MRRKYLKFIYKNLQKDKFTLVRRQVINYLLVSFSILTSKPYSGPFLVTINITRRCNLKCKMCGIKRSEKTREQELTLEEIKKLIDELKELKVGIISISGGEIFLRKDIFEIIEYVKKNGMFLNLSTNGTLINRKIAKRLLNLKVDSITISLDGAKAETHDSIRNVKGAYKKTIKTLKLFSEICKNSNTIIDIVTLISAHNIHEILDIINLVQKLGLDSIGFIPLHNGKIKHIWTKNEINEIIEKIILIKKRNGIIDNSEEYLRGIMKFLVGEVPSLDCGAGYLTCVIDSNGDIFPCYKYLDGNRNIGNVRNVNMKSFWFSSEYNDIRKKLFSCRECLWNCQHELNISFRHALILKSLLNRFKAVI